MIILVSFFIWTYFKSYQSSFFLMEWSFNQFISSVWPLGILKFSLTFSSRPPTYFSPYQKLLWILDAWTSLNYVYATIYSSIFEMWFKWHTSLWKHRTDLETNLFGRHGSNGLLPDMLFQPVKTLTLDMILERNVYEVPFAIFFDCRLFRNVVIHRFLVHPLLLIQILVEWIQPLRELLWPPRFQNFS